MKIAVYCSANNDIAEEYYDAARRLGEWMAASGHTLVWGGGSCSLMGCIGDTVHAHGGRTIGMVPRALEKTGRVSDNIDVYIPTNGLDDRKELMITQSDIAIALPGGIGTLDEIFTQAGSNTIGFHSKKVILYNVRGFWDTTIALLEFMQDNGMVRGHWTDYIVVAKDIEEISRLVV